MRRFTSLSPRTDTQTQHRHTHPTPPPTPTSPPPDPQGHITEADLRHYADAQGLPTAYVRPFLDALLTTKLAGDRDASATEETDEGAGAGAAGGGAVGFRRFRRFVVAREQGLREAFDMFDKGGSRGWWWSVK